MGEARAAAGGIIRFIIWFVVFAAVLSGITVLGFWIKAELSKPAGKAGVVIQNNDPNNQIVSQTNFGKLYSEIQGYEYTIHHSADPQEVSANRAGCVQAVDEYNAAAQGVTTRDWRDSSLPQSIPLTDCN